MTAAARAIAAMKFLMLRSKRVAIRRQEAAKHALDDVTLPVDGLVIMVLDLAVLARWDDGRGSAFCQPVAQGFAVIALVGDEFGGGRHGFDTALGDLAIMDVSWCQEQDEGPAFRIADSVELGVAAASFFVAVEPKQYQRRAGAPGYCPALQPRWHRPGQLCQRSAQSGGNRFSPRHGRLDVVVNERDGLGDGLVPDYFTRIRSGEFFGWPYAYSGPHPAPTWGAHDPDLVALTKAPDLMFQAHSAPLGLVDLRRPAVPRGISRGRVRGVARVLEFRPTNGIQGGAHPLWRRRTGRVLRKFRHRILAPRHFTRSSVRAAGGAGRGADGSLLIADDTSQTIWRVSYDPD